MNILSTKTAVSVGVLTGSLVLQMSMSVAVDLDHVEHRRQLLVVLTTTAVMSVSVRQAITSLTELVKVFITI